MYTNALEITLSTIAIIQARTGSTRLPGKITKLIGSLPLYQIVYDRVASSTLVDKVVFATTTNESDDYFCNELTMKGISFHRGSETDVLSRYKEAADIFNATIIVRITCDDPFKDPKIIDQCLSLMQASKADFSSNIIKKTFPEGLDVECMSNELLNTLSLNSVEDYQREHVTPYFYENTELYKHCSLTDNIDLSDYRLTLDDSIDYKLMTELYNDCGFNYHVGYDVLKHKIQTEYFRRRLKGRIQPYHGLKTTIRVQK